jgi:xanthine dehydrogenase accessory factor
MFDDFFVTAHALTERGQAFATATVVRAEKPTSGKPGDKAIITADGSLIGWIGGSCAQPTVIKEALKALREDESRLIRLSPDPAAQTPRPGLLDVPMTCYSGGTLEIYIEPHHPRPRLLIVGNLPVAQSLLHLGKALRVCL